MSKAARRNPKFVWESAFIKSRLTGNTGFIGLLMATFDNGDGRGFFLSQRRISEMTGLSERTVRTAIRTLTDEGWLEVTRRGGNRGDQATANTYALTVPSSQPEDGGGQPAGVGMQPEAQPEAGDRLVDQGTLNHPSLDHPSLDHSSLDLTSLREGDEVPSKVVEHLDAEAKKAFFPSFDKDEVMVYSPSVLADAPPEGRQRDRAQDWKAKASWERTLADEGLDENGEPLPRREVRSRGRR